MSCCCWSLFDFVNNDSSRLKYTQLHIDHLLFYSSCAYQSGSIHECTNNLQLCFLAIIELSSYVTKYVWCIARFLTTAFIVASVRKTKFLWLHRIVKTLQLRMKNLVKDYRIDLHRHLRAKTGEVFENYVVVVVASLWTVAGTAHSTTFAGVSCRPCKSNQSDQSNITQSILWTVLLYFKTIKTVSGAAVCYLTIWLK